MSDSVRGIVRGQTIKNKLRLVLRRTLPENGAVERRIDFSRERQMLCGRCDHRWRVNLGWIDRWEQGEETCPGCCLTGEHEDSPRVTVDPGDPALVDDRVARFFWYHTSTQADWPTRDFDPAAVLTPEMRRMMGGEQRVAAWAARQRGKGPPRRHVRGRCPQQHTASDP
ncbi:hypothetical protein [Streptomyces eurythermus]